MDRRYQVFVSSTFLDLAEERSAVVSALLQLDAIPAGMELFPAADDDAWTLIERVIDASDYYLLVIGGKYGSIDQATELSYTEREFDYAVGAHKPVMAFLHEDPDAIPAGKSEKTEEAQGKLAAFRKKVEQLKHVKYWAGADSLQGKVALSFASFTKSYPATGWIRGDVETAVGALAEINDLRKQLEAAKAQLTSIRTSPPPGVDDLEQGSDRFITNASASTKTRDGTKTSYGTVAWAEWSGHQEVDPTWDELFSAIGPTLLDEAEEGALRGRINDWLTQRWGDAFRGAIRRQEKEAGSKVEGFSGTRINLTADDFGTVLIQLRALGLIQRSDRKRSISDKATYWTLTPYGDTHLTTLRALRRSSNAGDVGPGEPEEVVEEEEEDE
jgi:hypothetical protein